MAIGLYRTKEAKERYKKMDEEWKKRRAEEEKREEEEEKIRERIERVRWIAFGGDPDVLIFVEDLERLEKQCHIRPR